jgi:hypothetical protein
MFCRLLLSGCFYRQHQLFSYHAYCGKDIARLFFKNEVILPFKTGKEASSFLS